MKQYNQPTTETHDLLGGYIMQGLVISPGGTPPNEDPAHVPARGVLIPD